jgi:hypothetical protein
VSKIILHIDSSYNHGYVKEIQLNQLAKAICLEVYNCKLFPSVIIDEVGNMLPGDFGGQYKNNNIVIARGKSNGITMYYFFHEIRHFLQENYCSSLYKYWSIYPGYFQYYDSIPIEVEAVEFGKECVHQSGQWRYPKGFELLESLDRVARRSLPKY